MVVACGCELFLVIFKSVAVHIHNFKVVGQIQVVGQISGIEVSVDT